MSASVILTKKFEILNLKEQLKSRVKGIVTSDFEAPFKIEIESTLHTSNCKGYFKIEL